MIVNPGIIALLLSSALSALMLSWAALFGLSVLRRWDMQSGTQGQLELERMTYLVSTLIAYTLVFELMALLLFIQSAEQMHTLFTGAMCAAGTLYANPYGYPALLIRVALSVFAGVWLVVNHLDSRAPDYPLIRLKYAMLMLLAPLGIASAMLSWLYLTGLRADVITSCCGSLFSLGSAGVRSEVAIVGGDLFIWIQYATAVLLFVSGVVYYRTGRGPLLYASLSGLMLPMGIVTLIVFVSPYIYELPTHHCPFCMLQSDYVYIGYPMYAALFMGAIFGMGAGIAGSLPSLATIPGGPNRIRRTLTVISLVAFVLFAALILWSIISSNLRWGGLSPLS